MDITQSTKINFLSSSEMRLGMKNFMIFILFTLSVVNLSVAQKKQTVQKYSDSLFNKSKELDITDRLLLKLLYSKTEFSENIYYPSLEKIFKKYNYSKSLNEFEKRKKISLIKKEIENRQRILDKEDYYIISYDTKYGSYSFDDGTLPIGDYYYPSNTIIYSIDMGSYTKILNWYGGGNRYNNLFKIEPDLSIFPSRIPVDEKKMEYFLSYNPSRKITVKILVKNLRQVGDDRQPLLVSGMATKIYDSKGLIFSFPTAESINNHLLNTYNYFVEIRNGWDRDEYYLLRNDEVKKQLNYCESMISSLVDNARINKIELNTQNKSNLSQLSFTTDSLSMVLSKRFYDLPIYDNNEYLLFINSSNNYSNQFNCSLIPKETGDSYFSFEKKKSINFDGFINNDILSPYFISADSTIMLRFLFDGSLFGNVIKQKFLKFNDIFPSINQEVQVDELPALSHSELPVYTVEMKKTNLEGKVFLKVLLDSKGTPIKAVTVKSSHKMLEDASLLAAMKYRFIPAKKNGKPVPVWVVIPFEFKNK